MRKKYICAYIHAEMFTCGNPVCRESYAMGRPKTYEVHSRTKYVQYANILARGGQRGLNFNKIKGKAI
jgi:hypothetical protein